MKCTVGITAGDRESPTLGQTIASLRDAGFESPRIFADGSFDIPSNLEVSVRSPSVGGWPNFWLALTEMVARSPSSDLFLIVQDDVVFSKGVFDYLAAAKFPDECGVVSLFCPKCSNAQFGWHPFPTGFGMASAQALAFPREMAFQFLADPWTVNYRRSAPKSKHFRGDGLHHIDGVVGQWCRLNDKAAYTHSPSLSQHIGRDSIMYPGFRGKRDVTAQ